MAKTGKRVIPNPNQRPLPPAGHRRDEEMRRRRDELMELADKLTSQMESEGIIDSGAPRSVNLAELSLENEVLSKRDLMRVKHGQEEYEYYWANHMAQHGVEVLAKQADGWEVVTKRDPEAKDMPTDALGRVCIADVVLMRIRLEKYVELKRFERAARRLRQEGVEAAFEELGDKYARRGIIAHSQMPTQIAERASTRREVVRQRALHHFDGMLRDGRVPGVRPGDELRPRA